MNAYVCVYRSRPVKAADRKMTKKLSEKDPNIQKFLDEYEESFYDWGDDPSFFAAKEFAGSASWGVCRPNVRAMLEPGDAVIFFCAKHSPKGCWDYFFVGVGVVKLLIADRNDIWKKRQFVKFRKYYNLLINKDGKWHEVFHPKHKDDWKLRLKRHYVVFDPIASRFDLKSPHKVAIWSRELGNSETWNNHPTSKKLQRLLFSNLEIKRGLRTSVTGFGHPHVNLGKLTKDESQLRQLVSDLRSLVRPRL